MYRPNHHIFCFKIICFMALVIISFAHEAKATTVVYKDARDRFLIVDKSSLSGVTKGSYICIQDDAGIVLTCSGVVLLSKKYAALRLPKSEMKRINVGSKVQMKPVFLSGDDLSKEQKPGKKGRHVYAFKMAMTNPEDLPKDLVKEAEEKEQELATKDLPLAEGAPKDSESVTDLTKGAGESSVVGGSGGGVAGGSGGGASKKTGMQSTGKAKDDKKKDNNKKDEKDTSKDGKVEETPTATGQVVQGVVMGAAIEQQPGTSQESEGEKADVSEKEVEKKGFSAIFDAPSQMLSRLFFGNEKQKKPPFKYVRFDLIGLIPIMSPLGFYAVKFKTIQLNETQRDTLWERTSSKPIAPKNGTGGQVRLMTKERWAYTFGGRYWNYDKIIASSQMDLNFPEFGVIADTKIVSSGIWGETGKVVITSPYTQNYVGLGLDFEMAELNFSATRWSQTEGRPLEILAFHRSAMNVISLRITGTQEFTFRKVGLALGGTVYVPFWMTKKSTLGEVSVIQNTALTKNAYDDLKDTIEHKPNKIGVEGFVSIFTQF